MPKLDDQLKLAITKMSAKEKDKLLLRLVAKDQKLVRRLIFELLEGGETRDDRSAEIRESMIENLPPTGSKYLTPGTLMMDLRHWNARITEHVNATKDKPGEVVLVVFMLAEALRRHGSMIHQFPPRRSDTLAPYVVKRTAAILAKAEKLHEDYLIEFSRDLNEVLEFIWNFRPMAALAQAANLPRSL